MQAQVAVIGSDNSRLASASGVSGLGHRVAPIENENSLSGLGTTFPWQGERLEKFYHCILPNDRRLLVARIAAAGQAHATVPPAGGRGKDTP